MILDSHAPIPSKSVHEVFGGFSFVAPTILDDYQSNIPNTHRVRHTTGGVSDDSAIGLRDSIPEERDEESDPECFEMEMEQM